MTCFSYFLRRAVLGTLFWLCSALAVLADCPQPADISLATLEDFETVAAAQRALHTGLGETRDGLTDGKLGPETQRAIVDLCQLLPQPAGSDPIRETLDAMQEYLTLSRDFEDWQGRLFERDLTADATGAGPKAIGLALAATPAITARALRRQPTAYDCTNITTDLSGDADAMQAMRAVSQIFGGGTGTDAQICALMSAPADAQSLRDTFARLGRLNRDHPGALAILTDADFLIWVDADRINRLRRLMATESTIKVLLDEYAESATYTGSSCTPSDVERTDQFYVLTEDDIANINTLISLTPVLQGFAQDHASFDSAGALWRELEPVLGAELDTCILEDIEPLVTGPDQLPKVYQLESGTADALSGLPVFQPVVAVLEDFQTRSFPTEDAFLEALSAALLSANTRQIGAQAVQIAETMADAAEPVLPQADNASVDIPEEDRLTPPVPQLRVTEAADVAAQSLVDNPGLTDLVESSTIDEAPVTGQIEGQVRRTLAPEVATQAESATREQLALLRPTITPNYGLTRSLSNAVTAIPYVRAAMSDATGAELPDRLASLAGVEYPSQRLFRRALMGVSSKEGHQPFSAFVIERIVDAATKTVPDPRVPRDYSQIAIPDCKCTPELRRENQHVYGFYPFWHAPRPEDRLPDGADPDPLRQIDFNMVSDLAFYGMEFTYPINQDGRGTLQLHNTEQWHDARRDFVNTAHRFRARADVAFDMRDWTQWSPEAVETAIALIVRELEPFERLPAYTPHDMRRAVPTLFDRLHPDGVTLIFPDYLGTDLSPAHMRQLVSIIKGVFESLPDRDAVRINVAFDFPLVGEDLNDPLFDELFQLLIERPYVLRADGDAGENGAPPALSRVDAKVISRVLLFLERPTSDAKKDLRFRMEQGLFQGKDREEALRSMILVLPPSGHRDILQSVRENPFRSEPPGEFSQFLDDVVYFEDNFAGVGFWPVSDSTSEDQADLKRIIAAEFNTLPWPRPFTGLETLLTSACDKVCPNRAWIMLAAIATFVVMLLLYRQSFYVGWAYTLGFKVFFLFGLVGLMNASILVALLALWQCDPFSTAPKIMFWSLLSLICLLWAYSGYQRIKNGRKP